MLSSSSSRWILPFFLLDISHVLGRILVPIHPHGTFGSRRRAQTPDLDLRSAETFLWGDEGLDTPIANLTVNMPDDAENILSMERFDGMLTDIECNADNIALTFEDDATFLYAQQVWDWVNGAENNSFVMVAGPGDCGNNTRRLPYVISSMQHDEVANKATLAASLSDWESIAHTYDLVVGGIGGSPGANNQTQQVQKRDIDKSTSIDFVHDFPFSVALDVNGLAATLACTNCSSSGSFETEFTISQKLFVPTGASMKMQPKDVSAIAQVKLSGSGSTDALTKEFTLLEIPISALTIPGVFDLGPFLTISVGAEILGLTLSAGVQTGATMKLDNAAILEVDLLNPEENTFSGWDPVIDTIDVRVDASISGGVAIFLKPALVLQAEALGQGFEVGINMKVPNINAKLTAIVSPQGACPAVEGQPKTTLGVNMALNIGGSLNFAFKKTSDDDPIFTVSLAAIDKPLAAKCFPFGDVIEARDMGMIRGASRRSISA